MIFDWLCREARSLTAEALLIPPSASQLEATAEERREQWLEMLGLWPLPITALISSGLSFIISNSFF